MIKNIFQNAVQSGVMNSPASLPSFRKRLEPYEEIHTSSLSGTDSALYFQAAIRQTETLVVFTPYERILKGFTGQSLTEHEKGVTYYALLCPLNEGNAEKIRQALPHTAPSVLKGNRSFGTGDRIGSPAAATPWHIEVCNRYGITPIPCQQSVRENTKTGRTFRQVMDDVTWSVFRRGYSDPWGADADHLKHIEEIEEAVRVGYTFYTLDPSDMIDNSADTDSDEILNGKLRSFFTSDKEADVFIKRYEEKYGFDARSVVRSGVKYLAAVRHAAKACHRLTDLLGESGFNFEMSIDETATPTTLLDHRIIATELAREDVHLYSLAPRFVGAFEKGIDYRGSVTDFRESLAGHVALSRELGDYRLSLHSGSDKFSIYPVFGELTDGRFHVKTAGTSFLEAMKVIAGSDLDLFKKIYALSVETFRENAASYEISADIDVCPDGDGLSSGEAVELITNSPDVRQALHIAFGVILKTMGTELRLVLATNSERYHEYLSAHLGKHLALLTGSTIH